MSELSSIEFIYLLNLCNVKKFYGLKDTFDLVNTQDIKKAINDAEISLAEKGIINLGFDKKPTINDNVKENIMMCINSRFCLVAEQIVNKQSQNSNAFYYNNNSICNIIASENNVTIKRINEDEVVSLILQLFCKTNYSENEMQKQFEIDEEDMKILLDNYNENNNEMQLKDDKLMCMLNKELKIIAVTVIDKIDNINKVYLVLENSKNKLFVEYTGDDSDKYIGLFCNENGLKEKLIEIKQCAFIS